MSFRKCNRKSPKYGIVRRAIIIIGCILSAGLLIYSSACHVRLVLYGIKANATVIRVERSGRTRTVTIRFSNETGQICDVRDNMILFAGRREVGDTIPIVYLPSQPEICVVQGMKGYTDLFIAICIFGLYAFGVLSLAFTGRQ